MRTVPKRGAQLCWTLAAGGVPFLVYLRTMAPTVFALDSAELTTGAYVLGIVHAPGAPTFMLLGHLFSWLPIGDVGYRLNLLSASAAALAITLVYRLGCRLAEDRALALAGSWCLAFSYYFWVSALAAELYAPQACCLAALLLLALQWRDGGGAQVLCAFTSLFGLSLGVHISMILTFPGFLWTILRGPLPAQRRGRVLGSALLCGLIGFSVYGYLPWRSVAGSSLDYARDYWQVDLTTVRGLLWMISGRMFATSFFGVALLESPRELALSVWRLSSNFAGLGLVLGAFGAIRGLREQRSLHIGLVAMVAAHWTFFLFYRVADKDLMFLPAYLIWCLWMILGAQPLCNAINRRLVEPWALSPTTLLLVLALAVFALNFRRVDLSRDTSARVQGETILAHLPENAVYVGTWADIPILEYLQIVEGRRPDVTLLNLVFLRDQTTSTVARHLADRAPVYTSAPGMVGEASFRFKYRRRCGCYLVRPRPEGAALRPIAPPMIRAARACPASFQWISSGK